jgi:uroporphyrinogen decarboxylase
MNDTVYEALSERKRPEGANSLEYLAFKADAFAAAGYDYVSTAGSDFYFPGGEHEQRKTKSLNDGAVITDWASFEAYPWPDPEKCDYSALEKISSRLPGNMKLMIMGPNGVLENVIGLTGYDNLCFMIEDEPALAGEIFRRVGVGLETYYRICAQHDSVGFLMANDDWGFNTQTFLSPAMMRKYVFPYHKKIADVAHAAGKPVALHSCGQLDGVMEDVIGMGIDARHSYEDVITPVEDFYEKWHDRIAIFGGIDINFIVTRTPEEVAARARALLERTATRGGYALGTGNSVPEYIPFENYCAMLKVALEA